MNRLVALNFQYKDKVCSRLITVLVKDGETEFSVSNDFWASWCVPCRKGSPHLIELYKQYHDNGLDIIGVSDNDNDQNGWKKAVSQDGVGTWHHVLRGLDWSKVNKGEKSPYDINEKYGTNSLPTKILIDKYGIIIGRYDKGTEEEKEAMNKKIAEVLK